MDMFPRGQKLGTERSCREPPPPPPPLLLIAAAAAAAAAAVAAAAKIQRHGILSKLSADTERGPG